MNYTAAGCCIPLFWLHVMFELFTPFLRLAPSSAALQTEIQGDLLRLNTKLKEKTFIPHLGK